jgi:hypothetical protein
MLKVCLIQFLCDGSNWRSDLGCCNDVLDRAICPASLVQALADSAFHILSIHSEMVLIVDSRNGSAY